MYFVEATTRNSNAYTALQNTPSTTCNIHTLLTSYRTVKTLKSFGFIPQKGTNKIPISTLSKEKIKKLGNLRVI